jgi:hypothetical protein
VAFKRLEAAGKTNVSWPPAKLDYFNARQNSLTRFFTLEYTNWFDLFPPGLHAVRSPIPSGGTSITSGSRHPEGRRRLGSVQRHRRL